MRADRRTLSCPDPFDAALTFGPISRGPSARVSRDDWWRAMNTPAGAVTVHVNVDRARARVVVEAWGPGRDWVTEHAGAITGLDDPADEFAPDDPTVAALRHSLRGMRLASLGCAFDLAAFTVIEQRVTSLEAGRSWRRLVYKHGRPAPAHPELPRPATGRRDPRAPGLGMAAARSRGASLGDGAAGRGRSGRIDRAADNGSDALARRLGSLRGVGPWTAATVVHYVAGDADAVPVGDWHLPGHVGHTLAGEPHADDARMLELLEPFRPHRAWVWRLVVAGSPRPPRRAQRARIIGLLHAEANRPRGTTRSARR